MLKLPALLLATSLAFAPLALRAQSVDAITGNTIPVPPLSSGPFQMADGERVTFGFLVPAVQRARANAQFSIMDSTGTRVFTFVPDAGKPVTLTLTFHGKAAGNQAGASFEINGGTINGGVSQFVPAGTDGILIGLLLPAVQRNGQLVAPLATSMQSFNVNGGTMTFSHLAFHTVP
jgi:hypothetical protein